MGKNNRARRQQKQRKKQAKQSDSIRSRKRSILSQQELLDLCHPLQASFAHCEPPPPSVMKDWSTFPYSSAAQPLRTLLIGFVDFLFHHAPATGNVAQLAPYQRDMRAADLDWLATLLYVYGVISERTLVEGDVDVLQDAIARTPLPANPMEHDDPNMVLYAPLYLSLWATGSQQQFKHCLGDWLHIWLVDSPFEGLTTPIKKLLSLKAPKPEQKTVQALDAALAKMEFRPENVWFEGVQRLLTLFLACRLTPLKREPESWQKKCPHLARWAGIVDTPASAAWSRVQIGDADTATLNRLNYTVRGDDMPYQEQVMLETFRCRVLSRYANSGEVGVEDFERQLEQLIHLLTRAAPKEEGLFAQQCLNLVCEWLAEQVGVGRVQPPSLARIRGLQRDRPDDYRVLLLTFLARSKNSPSKVSHGSDLEYIHHPLFFRAIKLLNSRRTTHGNFLVDGFYWSLTVEARKALFIHCCEKIFLSMDDNAAEELWEPWQHLLFDAQRAPFNTIIGGHACEARMLFFTAIAAANTGVGNAWLLKEQLPVVLRFAEAFCRRHPSDFMQYRIVDLLNSLAQRNDAARLFSDWSAVVNLLKNIAYIEALEGFMQVALANLDTCTDVQRDDVYRYCRHIPSLRHRVPSLAAQKKQNAAKRNTRNAPQKPVKKLSQNVDSQSSGGSDSSNEDGAQLNLDLFEDNNNG